MFKGVIILLLHFKTFIFIFVLKYFKVNDKFCLSFMEVFKKIKKMA